MSKVQTSPREQLRRGIRELWAASKSGTQLDKRQAIKKIKNAVVKEEQIMLNKIQVEETDELDEILEGLELAEELTDEKPVIAETPAVGTQAKESVSLFHPGWSSGREAAVNESPEQLRAKELRAAGKSLSAIAREVFGVSHVSVFYINKVKRLIGETPAGETAKGAKVDGAEPPQEKRSYNRRASPAVGTQAKVEPLGVTEEKPGARGSHPKTVETNGAGQPLALNGSGHNGHDAMVHLSPAQLSKLWEIVTGGQVGIQIEGGQVSCWVSESSFRKALPALIDRL